MSSEILRYPLLLGFGKCDETRVFDILLEITSKMAKSLKWNHLLQCSNWYLISSKYVSMLIEVQFSQIGFRFIEHQNHSRVQLCVALLRKWALRYAWSSFHTKTRLKCSIYIILILKHYLNTKAEENCFEKSTEASFLISEFFSKITSKH